MTVACLCRIIPKIALKVIKDCISKCLSVDVNSLIVIEAESVSKFVDRYSIKRIEYLLPILPKIIF